MAGAVAWGLLAWALPVSYFLGACLVLAAAGVLLAVIDLRVLRLPDPIVLACFVVTGVLLALQALSTSGWSSYGRAWLGGAAAFVLLGGVVYWRGRRTAR